MTFAARLISRAQGNPQDAGSAADLEDAAVSLIREQLRDLDDLEQAITDLVTAFAKAHDWHTDDAGRGGFDSTLLSPAGDDSPDGAEGLFISTSRATFHAEDLDWSC
jgi:hypothetical protein